MKVHNCMKLLVIGIAAVAMFSDVQAQPVWVVCDDKCVIINILPDPVTIIVPGTVTWEISMSCTTRPPCVAGACTITIPPQPGYAGWTGTGGPGRVGPSAVFSTPGTYKYTVACSPEDTNIIIVTSPDTPAPTLTEWGMIVFCVLLFGWMAWVIVRRRKRVTIRA